MQPVEVHVTESPDGDVTAPSKPRSSLESERARHGSQLSNTEAQMCTANSSTVECTKTVAGDQGQDRGPDHDPPQAEPGPEHKLPTTTPAQAQPRTLPRRPSSGEAHHRPHTPAVRCAVTDAMSGAAPSSATTDAASPTAGRGFQRRLPRSSASSPGAPVGDGSRPGGTTGTTGDAMAAEPPVLISVAGASAEDRPPFALGTLNTEAVPIADGADDEATPPQTQRSDGRSIGAGSVGSASSPQHITQAPGSMQVEEHAQHSGLGVGDPPPLVAVGSQDITQPPLASPANQGVGWTTSPVQRATTAVAAASIATLSPANAARRQQGRLGPEATTPSSSAATPDVASAPQLSVDSPVPPMQSAGNPQEEPMAVGQPQFRKSRAPQGKAEWSPRTGAGGGRSRLQNASSRTTLAEVIPHRLYLGSFAAVCDTASVQRAGVSAFVCCAQELPSHPPGPANRHAPRATGSSAAPAGGGSARPGQSGLPPTGPRAQARPDDDDDEDNGEEPPPQPPRSAIAGFGAHRKAHLGRQDSDSASDGQHSPVGPAAPFYHLKMQDTGSQQLVSLLGPLWDFLDSVWADGRAVAVYCMRGISRSGAVAVAAYMRFYQVGYTQAIEGVRRVRREVDPNFGFCLQLEQLGAMFEEEKKLRQRAWAQQQGQQSQPQVQQPTAGQHQQHGLQQQGHQQQGHQGHHGHQGHQGHYQQRGQAQQPPQATNSTILPPVAAPAQPDLSSSSLGVASPGRGGSPQSVSLHNTTNNLTPQQSLTGQQSLNVPGTMDFMNTLRSYQSLESVSAASPYPAQSLAESRRGSQSHGGSGSVWPVPQQVPAAFGHRTVPSPSPQNSQGHQHFTGGTGGFFTSNDSSPQHGMQSAVYQAQITPKGFVIQPLQHHHQSDGDPGLSRHGLGAQSAPAGAPQFARHGAPDSGRSGRSRSGSLSQSGAPPGGWSASVVSGQPLLSDRYMGVRSNSLGSDLFSGGLSCASVPISVVSVPTMGGVPVGFGSSPGASLPMSGPTSGATSSGPAGLAAALSSGTQFLPPVLSAQVAATLQSPRSTTTAGTTTGTKSSMSNASGTGSFLLQQQREASPGQVSASANPAGSPQSQPGVPSNHTTTTTTTTATTTTASGASGVGHSSQLPPVPQKGSPDRRRASSIVQLGPQHSVSHRGSRPSLGPVPGSQMSLLGNAGSQLSLHPQGSNLFAQQQGQSPTLKSVPSFGGQSLHSAQSTLSTGSFINASNARLGPQAQGQPGQPQGQQQDPQPVQGFGRGQQQQGSQHQLLPQPQPQQTGGVAFPGNFAANVVPPSAPAEPPAAIPAVTYHRNSMQSLDGSALVSPMTSVRGHHLLSASTSHSNTPQTVSPVRRQSLQNNVLALYGARSGAGAGGAPGLHSQRHSPAVSSSPARSAVLNASSSHGQGNQPGEQEGSQPGFDSVAGFSGYDFGLPSVHRVSAQPTPAQTPGGTAHMLLSVDTARSLGGGTVQSYATSGLSGPAVGAANFGAFQVPAHARGAGNFGASLPGGWSPSQVSAPGSRSGGSVAAVPIDNLQSGHPGHPFRSGGASINEHSSNRSWNASMAEAGSPQQWPHGSLTTPMGGSVSPAGRPAQLSFSETPSIAAPSSSRTMTTSSAFGTQHSPQTGSTVSGFGSDRFQAQPRGPDWSTTALTTGHVGQPTLVMARVPSLGTSSDAAQSIRPQLSVSPATLPPAMQGQGSAFPQEPRAEFTMNVAHAKAPFSSSTPPEAEPTQPIPGASPVGAPLFQRLSVGDATGLGGPTTRQMSGGTAAPTPQSPVSAVGDAVPGPSSVCSPNMPRESSAAAATAGPGSAVQQDLKHFPSGSHDSGSSSSHRPRTEGGSGDAPLRQSSLRSSLGQFVSQSDSDDDTAIPLSSVARRIHAARHSARRLSDHDPPHRTGSMPESNGSPRPPSICSFSSVGGLAAHPGNRSGANRTGSALDNDDAMSFTSRRLAQLQRTETLPAMDDTAVDRILREEADRRRDLDAALRSTDLVESVIVQHRGSDSTSTGLQGRLSSSEAAPGAGSSAGDPSSIMQPLSAIRAVGSSSSMASPPNPTAVGLSNARAALPDLAQRSRDPSDAAAGTSSRRSEGRAPSLGTTAPPGALGALTSSTASFSPSPPRASIATNPRDGTGLGGLTGSSMALAGMTMSSEGTDRRTSTNTARTVRPEQQQALVPTPTGSSATPPPTDARRPATEREGIVSLHPETLGAEGEDGRHSAHGDSAASDPNLRSSNDGSTSPQARTVQRLLRALSSAQAHDDDPSEHSEGLTSGRWSAQRGLAGSELTPRRSDSGLISRDGSVSVGKRQSSEIPPLPPTGLALQRARSMSSQSDAESHLHHTDTNNTTVGTTSLPPLGGPRSRSPSEMVESGAVSPVARVPLPAMVPETASGAPSPLHQGGEVKRGTLRPSKQRHSSGGQE